jgi:hypothetical protein
MKKLASSLAIRRVEFFSLDPTFPCYGIDLTTPSGSHLRWVVLPQPAAQARAALAPEFVFERTFDGKKDPGYPLPGELKLSSPTLSGRIQLEREVLRHNPLEHLPTAVRWLASTAFNLHPRRIWALSSFTLTLPTPQDTPTLVRSTTSVEHHGTGVTAVTFLNPLPTR